MFSPDDMAALANTLRLAAISTFFLLLLSTPTAYILIRMKGRMGRILETLLALPIVLPPTVLGFYLLLLMGPNGALGKISMAVSGRPLAFGFTGLVIGSVLYSLPFVTGPLKNAFLQVDPVSIEAAATLGASPADRFFSVIIPQSVRGFISAAALGFAHTLGEFGVVLMIGGNIPGSTRVVSIAIYEHVEALRYANAHRLSALLLAGSLLLLLPVYGIGSQHKNRSRMGGGL